MKTKIIILRILFIISLIISLLLINNTFAKYQESISTDYKSNIKRWKLIINDHVLRNGESLINLNEAGIEPIFKNNEYMADDIIVPGREGYFEIPINFEKVDVPFSFNLNIEQYETSSTYNNLPDFQFYGYCIGGGDIFYYNLPEEYKQVEYIESNGKQYFDREVFSDADSEETSVDFSKVKLENLTEQLEDYKNSIIVSHLVPCYRVLDGVIGMYDIVSGTFITDFAEGDFTKGEDIENVVIYPESEKYKDIEKAETVYAYVRWLDGDGTSESLVDVFNNAEDTDFVTNGENTDVKYKATLVFEQYIKE